MELVRWEPFAGFGNGRSVFDDLFDDNLGRSWAQPSTSKWYPAVDVLESKDSYHIRAELPGMKREDFKVEVTDGNLTLSGERKSEKLAEGVEYRHVERVDAKFWRSFSLPETVKTRRHRSNLQRRCPRDTRAQGGGGQATADRSKRALTDSQIATRKGRQIASLFFECW